MKNSRQQPSEVATVLTSIDTMVLTVSSDKGLENQRGSYLREFESPSPGHTIKLLQTPKTPYLATLSATFPTQKQNKNLAQHSVSSRPFSLEYGKYKANNSRIIAELFSATERAS